jgi:hypothetical protein
VEEMKIDFRCPNTDCDEIISILRPESHPTKEYECMSCHTDCVLYRVGFNGLSLVKI